MNKTLFIFLCATTFQFFANSVENQYIPAEYQICNMEQHNKEISEEKEEENIDIAEHPIETGIKLAIICKVLVSIFNWTKGSATDADHVFLLSLGLAGVSSLLLPSFLKITKKQEKCDYYAKLFVIVGSMYSEYLRFTKHTK